MNHYPDDFGNAAVKTNIALAETQDAAADEIIEWQDAWGTVWRRLGGYTSGEPLRPAIPDWDALSADEWTHVAVTWDAGDPVMRLFKNGQEIDSVAKAGSAVATGPGVQIGIGNQSISALAEGPGNEIRPFDGLIDEVRVYRRGLSEAELRYLVAGP